jgi:hypothetical protein
VEVVGVVGAVDFVDVWKEGSADFKYKLEPGCNCLSPETRDGGENGVVEVRAV